MNTIFDIRSSVDVERFSRIKEIERKMLVYTIRLCFGFGVGWAIEDAKRSNFKIDANYLSEHVNMAF